MLTRAPHGPAVDVEPVPLNSSERAGPVGHWSAPVTRDLDRGGRLDAVGVGHGDLRRVGARRRRRCTSGPAGRRVGGRAGHAEVPRVGQRVAPRRRIARLPSNATVERRRAGGGLGRRRHVRRRADRRALADEPNQLRFISAARRRRVRNTTNSACVPCGGWQVERDVVHVCQPPVGATCGGRRPAGRRRVEPQLDRAARAARGHAEEPAEVLEVDRVEGDRSRRPR